MTQVEGKVRFSIIFIINTLAKTLSKVDKKHLT